jgi:branched-subunit amino acid transport protein
MSEFLAIALVGLGTYSSRALFIVALARRRIPEPLLVALQFVAPSVLAALIVSLLTDGQGNVAIGVPEVSAFVLGGAVAIKTRNHILTLVVGMGVYWMARALV